MLYHTRSIQEKDALAVYNFICILEEKTFDYAVFESIFKENIHNKSYYYLVAESDNGSLVGFISCHIQNLLHHCGKVAEIQELFVDENCRGKGVGALLINHLEKNLLKAQCLLVEVTAQDKRRLTHNFYEGLGFECTHKKFVKSLS